jgi:type III pantothenate kinase
MILLLDVGNTQTEVGIYSEQKKLTTWRFSSKLFSTEDEIASLIGNFLKFKDVDFSQIDDLAISSVVPELSFVLKRFGIKYFEKEPLMVSSNLRLPISIQYNSPENVGADRICGSVAAYSRYKKATIIIDFGTATTLDVVTSKGEYIGGVIALGIESSINTLHQKASKLPMVTYEVPETVIGHSTDASIKSGIFNGNIHLVNGLLIDIQRELGDDDIQVVTTGGLATLVHPYIHGNPIHHPDLILDGLIQILKMNR